MRVLDYDIPDDLYISKEHEWVRVEGKIAVIGMTDYAQKSLHEVSLYGARASNWQSIVELSLSIFVRHLQPSFDFGERR